MSTQLPAHLAGRNLPRLADKAVAGIGSAMPPHISIQGNSFTLVDATGRQQPAGATLTCCIVDVSDHNCKRYYADKWKPDSKDPPLCWSANGVAPSREALEPQSPTCAACDWNVRGSETSAISGVAIKACRDEKWLAVLIPQIPNMLFQLVLTPGSFKNWRAFVQPFLDDGTVDMKDVLTTLAFQPQVNGVLTFAAANFIDVAVADVRDKALLGKQTDALVGRNDVPRQAALAAPQQVQQPASGTAQLQPATEQPGQQFGQFSAGAGSPSATQSHTGAAPEPQRRRRRTQAEIQADAAAKAAQAPAGQPAGQQAPFSAMPQQLAQQAPFGAASPQTQQPAQQPGLLAQPAGGGAGFGMATGVAPNPELTAALDSVFGKPA